MRKKATIISNCSRNSRSSRISRLSGLSILSRSSRTFGSLILLAALLLTACQSDSITPDDDRRQTSMELLTFSNSFLDVTPWRSATRTDYDDYNFNFGSGYTDHLPTGYVSYENLYPQSTPNNSTIGVFLTPGSTTSVGNFIYEGVENGVNKWRTTIVVKEGQQYFIYGFMPHQQSQHAVITPLGDPSSPDGGFAAGATMTIQNIEALTPADVSVIVGVRWATDEEKINGTKDYDVPLGNFEYNGREDGKNRLFVLLKHIYAGLHFAATVDPTYAALRTIRITRMELIARNITENINLSLTLRANKQGLDPLDTQTDITYEPIGQPTSTSSIVLFPYEDSEPYITVPSGAYSSFLGCFAPSSCESFVLRTTYDVYDKDTSQSPDGNLIRKNCVAENKIDKGTINTFPNLVAGQEFTVKLTIKPTFLYALSDPDLDNPTIVVN